MQSGAEYDVGGWDGRDEAEREEDVEDDDNQHHKDELDLESGRTTDDLDDIDEEENLWLLGQARTFASYPFPLHYPAFVRESITSGSTVYYAVVALSNAQEEAKRRGLKTAFTITRAVSAGMNRTFAKSGFTFAGTLVNNTHISGHIQSMNIWWKDLCSPSTSS